MQNKKSQNKSKRYINQNTIEALTSIPKGLANAAGNEAKALGKGAWEQFLGIGEQKPKKGDLKQGEELSLADIKDQQEAPKMNIEPGINYVQEIVHAEKRSSQEQTQELSVKIQEIIIELKQLMNVSQELKVEFKEIAIDQRIANPGKYHVSFFEWVLLIVKQARMKVEDSQAWLGAFKSKKAKKQYWSMFKKHGTTFGMSNERVVATQTG